MSDPICLACCDAHIMTLHREGHEDREVMCTRCPAPCQNCRAGGNGPFCATTPCACSCHARPPVEAAGVVTRPTLWAHFEDGALVHVEERVSDLCCAPAEAVRYEPATEARGEARASRSLAPAVDPADEALIDELLAKRAAGLETRPMHRSEGVAHRAWAEGYEACKRDYEREAGLAPGSVGEANPYPAGTSASVVEADPHLADAARLLRVVELSSRLRGSDVASDVRSWLKKDEGLRAQSKGTR